MQKTKLSPDELREIMRRAGYNTTCQGKEFAKALGITIDCLRKWLNEKNPAALCTEFDGRPTIHGRGLAHLIDSRKGKKQVTPEKPRCAYCGGEFKEQKGGKSQGARLVHTCPSGTETKTPFRNKGDRERMVTPINL